jgi:adenine-specific DNA-methyltransferase
LSRITDLIAKAKAQDPQFGADLEREFRALSSRLSFGLNFERHRPEAVELPQRPVRRGDKVRILPPRGSTAKGDQRLWLVDALHKTKKTADLKLLGATKPEAQTVTIDDLVVIAEFRDTIYPGLISTGKVSRGGDKPWHTVINGENYHALKALTWTHRGKVDVIYIDPPYNTGAKDWKYNNDYVEGDDLYRHSKWLAMMERRLLIAKELLNPSDSVLIVTIDEKEYLRLGLLLEQTFPEGQIQMVTSVISPFGVARENELSRVDEYLFFVRIGKAALGRPNDSRALLARSEEESDDSPEDNAETFWFSFMRAGSNSTRNHSPGCHYPIFVTKDGEFHSVGKPLPDGEPRESVRPPRGTVACWPIKTNKQEGVWQASAESAKALFDGGYARIGKYSPRLGRYSITYLREGSIQRIKANEVVLAPDGEITVLRQAATSGRTVWAFASHNATSHGTKLLAKFLPGRRFPYPKSLFAVEDALRTVVAQKPQATIVDFFAGSGTTAHAVMRLNKQDGGMRQCICITNNEVGPDEQQSLREEGLRPGDRDWERWGICDHITKPRVKAAICGKTPEGEPLKGEYKFVDEFPFADGFAENAEFFTLTYETPVGVSHQTAFSRIAPLLWLHAGSFGRCIEEIPVAGWDVADSYGLLVDLDGATDFLKVVRKAKSARVAYIVTDDERRFQAISLRLREGITAVRLYESYLTNFAFANGEGA